MEVKSSVYFIRAVLTHSSVYSLFSPDTMPQSIITPEPVCIPSVIALKVCKAVWLYPQFKAGYVLSCVFFFSPSLLFNCFFKTINFLAREGLIAKKAWAKLVVQLDPEQFSAFSMKYVLPVGISVFFFFFFCTYTVSYSLSHMHTCTSAEELGADCISYDRKNSCINSCSVCNVYPKTSCKLNTCFIEANPRLLICGQNTRRQNYIRMMYVIRNEERQTRV